MVSDIDTLKKIADPSDFTCPECGGGLWAIRSDAAHRYRFHTGHVYTEKTLEYLQDENIEESIWVSIRMLDEKYNLLKIRMARDADGDAIDGAIILERLGNLEIHIARLK